MASAVVRSYGDLGRRSGGGCSGRRLARSRGAGPTVSSAPRLTAAGPAAHLRSGLGGCARTRRRLDRSDAPPRLSRAEVTGDPKRARAVGAWRETAVELEAPI